MDNTQGYWGTIEGFFGRDWGWDARAAHLRFLGQLGAQIYIYAPKSDRILRQEWRAPWPAATFDALLHLRERARASGVAFGLGLCPFDMGKNEYDTVQYSEKLRQINALRVDLCAVLCDDTMGGAPDLATVQLALFAELTDKISAPRFAFCPAYYSDDPVLDRVFNPRPPGYLETLGRGLDPEVSIFWTGPQVVSSHYPRPHLHEVAERLRRKPLIWDNWPVNDSARLSDFLRLGPPQGRGAEIKDLVAGMILNPMNQPSLSQLPLAAFAGQWQGADPRAAWDHALRMRFPPHLAHVLRQYLWLLSEVGLSGMTAPVREALRADLAPVADHPAAQEVLDWLEGGYVFDPACLT